MKISRILKITIYTMLLFFTLVSCEEEHISSLPTFSGFRLTPSKWYAGDSVTVTAVQQSKGDLIYKADYYWTIKCQDSVYIKSVRVVYDNDKSDPYFSIKIPETLSGTTTISFNAEYHYSAKAPSVINTGTTQAGNIGSIRTTGSGTISGKCSGSATTTIYSK